VTKPTNTISSETKPLNARRASEASRTDGPEGEQSCASIWPTSAISSSCRVCGLLGRAVFRRWRHQEEEACTIRPWLTICNMAPTGAEGAESCRLANQHEAHVA